MTRILLLTTVISEPTRLALCEQLIASISSQLSPAIDVKHHLLVQKAQDTEIGRRIAEKNTWISFHHMPERLSLSRARNVLLELTERSGDLGNADIVAFPDDDAWYPLPLLYELSLLFESQLQPDIFVCRYSSVPEPAKDLHSCVAKPSLLEFVKCASSNTMFIKGDIVRKLGRFDEALGVGTPTPGAEDLDYALRARLASERVCLLPSALVGHRDKSVALKAKYYAADLLVLMRHATNDLAHTALVGRKLLVGLYLVARRRLSIGVWFHAFFQAIGHQK